MQSIKMSVLIEKEHLQSKRRWRMYRGYDDLYCPKCGKKAKTLNPIFRCYSMCRLELPIFLCSDCRTIYIDRPIVRKIISEFRKDGPIWMNMSFETMCREVLGKLEELAKIYCAPSYGYKKVRFLKNPPKSNP